MTVIRPLLFSLAVSAALLFSVSSAMALDLQQARSEGLVGEKDGYIVPIKHSADVDTLVEEVNAGRRKAYMSISRENGQPVDVVAKLASEQIIQKLPAGSKYRVNGDWQTR